MILAAYRYKYSSGALLVNFADSLCGCPAGYTVIIDGQRQDFTGTPAGYDAALEYYHDASAAAAERDELINTD